MRTRTRILVSIVVLFGAIGLVMALTYVGEQSRGPLSTFSTRVGSWFSAGEQRLAMRMRGPGRRAELAGFDTLRTVEALTHPARPLLGIYDNRLPTSLEGVLEVEAALDTHFPLIHVFTAWGDYPDYPFPVRTAEAIWEMGSVPVITWEPWLSPFTDAFRSDLRPTELRDERGLADVASGLYDAYLRAWARDAVRFGRPVLVRFAHEMNDAYRYPWGPHQNTPEEFIAAWRQVVQVFRQEGASNVIWVWSPHVAYDGFEAYFPGDDVVDWVGATVLNYGTVAYWSQWWTFDDIFTRKYDRLRAFGKPIMVAELGSIMAGGERAPWYAQALTRLPQRLPEVKAVMFFHNQQDATITYQALNWGFAQDHAIVDAIRDGLSTWPDSLRIP